MGRNPATRRRSSFDTRRRRLTGVAPAREWTLPFAAVDWPPLPTRAARKKLIASLFGRASVTKSAALSPKLFRPSLARVKGACRRSNFLPLRQLARSRDSRCCRGAHPRALHGGGIFGARAIERKGASARSLSSDGRARAQNARAALIKSERCACCARSNVTLTPCARHLRASPPLTQLSRTPPPPPPLSPPPRQPPRCQAASVCGRALCRPTRDRRSMSRRPPTSIDFLRTNGRAADRRF